MAQQTTGNKVTINVNGHDHVVDAPPDSMLLYALRDDLGLRGPKFGCGLSECGACTVIMNGTAVHSCITPLSFAEGQKITTLEGLGTKENPSELQQAFIDEQAAQCGYCIGGMIMTAQALLDRNPHPTRDDIKQALDGNLCRCGTHMRILRAVEHVANNNQTVGTGTKA
jgi:nicotinate dehydrogenase subunit A